MKPPSLIEQIELFKRCVTEMLVIRDNVDLQWSAKKSLITSKYFTATLDTTGLFNYGPLSLYLGNPEPSDDEVYTRRYIAYFVAMDVMHQTLLPELNEAFNPKAKAEPKPRTLREDY